MARVVHLHLDAGTLGPVLARIGACGRACAAILDAAVATLHHRRAPQELQRLDHRLLRDLELHREGQADWRHLDVLTPWERGRIDWPHY